MKNYDFLTQVLFYQKAKIFYIEYLVVKIIWAY